METKATNLYTALLAAQRAMGSVKKDAKNPAFRSSYATLQSILTTIEEPLWENGLLVVQQFQYDRVGYDGGSTAEGTPILITRLVHAASGESIESVVTVASKDPHDPQKVGSAITYYRRYSLLALLGLTPEEDDDGNAAAQPRPAPRQPAPQLIAPAPRPTPPERPQEPRNAPGRPTTPQLIAEAPSVLTNEQHKKVADARDLAEAGAGWAAVREHLRPTFEAATKPQKIAMKREMDAIQTKHYPGSLTEQEAPHA